MLTVFQKWNALGFVTILLYRVNPAETDMILRLRLWRAVYVRKMSSLDTKFLPSQVNGANSFQYFSTSSQQATDLTQPYVTYKPHRFLKYSDIKLAIKPYICMKKKQLPATSVL